MQTNKNIISKKDYDFYTIPLPISVLFKRQKKQYINAQLEKIHPCYSDDFCFKSRMKLEKGLKTDVVVINKFTLSDYKSRFPRKKLIFEDLKKSYQNFDNKIIPIFSIFIFLFLVFMFFGFKINSLKKEKITQKNIETIKTENPKQENQAENEKEFFNLVSKNNGKIENFSFSKQNSYKKFSAKICSVYPEIFNNFGEKLNISPILYSEKNPSFKIEFFSKNVEDLQTVQKTDFGQKNDVEFEKFLKNFREILFLENCKLISEDKYNFSFVLSGKNQSFKIIGKIAAILETNDIGISKINFIVENDEIYKLELQIEKNLFYKQGFNLNLLKENESLFAIYQKKSALQNKKIQNVKTVETKNLQESENLNKKLGEIRKNDGTKIIFYKTQEGKILKEVVNEK